MNSKLKASIALWILTKFAIVFFIFALGAILTTYGFAYREKLCEEQANFIARQVLASINSVVISPAEDEIKTFKLEPTIRFTKDDFAVYDINITALPKAETAKSFIVDVVAPGRCASKLSIKFESADESKKIDKVYFVDYLPGGTPPKDEISQGEVFTFKPFNVKEPASSSRFLVFLKCTKKEVEQDGTYSKFLFIQGCRKDDSKECLNFKTRLEQDVSNIYLQASGSLEEKKWCGWS